jgi:hypothetical protein
VEANSLPKNSDGLMRPMVDYRLLSGFAASMASPAYLRGEESFSGLTNYVLRPPASA